MLSRAWKFLCLQTSFNPLNEKEARLVVLIEKAPDLGRDVATATEHEELFSHYYPTMTRPNGLIKD